MARYFPNTLLDFQGGTVSTCPSTLRGYLRETLTYVLGGQGSRHRFSVYTGTAGLAYTCWHLHRHAAALGDVIGERDLVEVALQLSRGALHEAEAYPLQDHGWALLGGGAGVFATAALCFNTALHFEEKRGKIHLAAGLREELGQCLRRFQDAGEVALTEVCREDEFLYGRAGYVFGGLLLNRHVRADAVPPELLRRLAEKILQSGRRQARETEGGGSSPLYFHWHDKPYLGAAHGMIGILYVLLHLPELLAEGGGTARGEVEAALRYVLTLECDAQGVRGQHGHYPTQMGPWRDREPLVHWCHGATGAVFLFCKAYEVLGDAAYLEAAGRSGEAVWGHGLLKKGPGTCHGVSGSAYALLRLYRTTHNPMWLHRAVEFGKFMQSPEFEGGARTPDHPRSLFEGWAAACCLWADLLQPDTAGFPLFELDI